MTRSLTSITEDRVAAASDQLARSYDNGRQVNLAGYAGSLLTYGASTGLLALLVRRSARPLPARFEPWDVVLGGLATYKFSRLLTKGSVTAPVRAPFTEFEDSAGAAEHQERARGEHGVRHTVGELLTCPFCLGQWIGTGYVAGLVLAPRGTRAWAAVFAVTGISDALQHGFNRMRAG
jgi:hypothetical protein